MNLKRILVTLGDLDHPASCPLCGSPMAAARVGDSHRIVYRCARDCRYTGRNLSREHDLAQKSSVHANTKR